MNSIFFQDNRLLSLKYRRFLSKVCPWFLSLTILISTAYSQLISNTTTWTAQGGTLGGSGTGTLTSTGVSNSFGAISAPFTRQTLVNTGDRITLSLQVQYTTQSSTVATATTAGGEHFSFGFTSYGADTVKGGTDNFSVYASVLVNGTTALSNGTMLGYRTSIAPDALNPNSTLATGNESGGLARVVAGGDLAASAFTSATLTFSITKISDGNYTLSYGDGTNSFSGTWVVTTSSSITNFTGSLPQSLTFDAISFRDQGTTNDAATITNVSAVFTPAAIPEPSCFWEFMLALGSLFCFPVLKKTTH
ncbi:MAG: hypothetical protein V4507_02240 [Verrucomicrobiota bacterium]